MAVIKNGVRNRFIHRLPWFRKKSKSILASQVPISAENHRTNSLSRWRRLIRRRNRLKSPKFLPQFQVGGEIFAAVSSRWWFPPKFQGRFFLLAIWNFRKSWRVSAEIAAILKKTLFTRRSRRKKLNRREISKRLLKSVKTMPKSSGNHA